MATSTKTKAQEVSTDINQKPAATKTAAQPLGDQISQRAYELWQKRGCVHGFDQQDWLEAERLLCEAIVVQHGIRTGNS